MPTRQLETSKYVVRAASSRRSSWVLYFAYRELFQVIDNDKTRYLAAGLVTIADQITMSIEEETKTQWPLIVIGTELWDTQHKDVSGQ